MNLEILLGEKLLLTFNTSLVMVLFEKVFPDYKEKMEILDALQEETKKLFNEILLEMTPEQRAVIHPSEFQRTSDEVIKVHFNRLKKAFEDVDENA